MSLAERRPSTQWEPVAIPDRPECAVWAWFRPGHAPHAVLFQVPEEARGGGPALTMRRLLEAAAIDARETASWTVLGMTYPTLNGTNPLLDQPLPSPGPQGIAVHTFLRAPAAVPTEATVAAAPPIAIPPAADPGTQHVLEALDAEWQAIILHERHLEALRRQVGSIQGTLQSLNRDLDPDERLYSDTVEKKDWQEARRWLRDALALVSKAIRAHDIGVTSAAGNRRRFEELHKEYIEPRRGFPGMEAERLAFEQHRKNNQSLIMQMQSAHAFAAHEGVQRAQSVLVRIAAKVRAARAKR